MKSPLSAASGEDALAALRHLQQAHFKGFQSQRGDLLALLKATLDHGESNSVLLLGPRGTGKTALLESVLLERGLHLESASSRCRLVRLHGLTETSDRLALKKISRHLRLDGRAGDRVFGSFAEHLEFLLESLKQGGEASSASSVVFVLEEFDLFCAHHNQTLLYNLFDIAQSARKVPILVIGLTARIDVIEILEKRVQSRFGRRCIHLSKPASFQEYFDFVRHFLLPEEGKKDFSKEWIRAVNDLLESRKVNGFFDDLFRRNSVVSFLKQLLQLALFNVRSHEEETLSLAHLEEAAEEMCQDLEQSQLLSLPMLDLTLLIAAMHLQEIKELQSFNFEMVFSEFNKFTNWKCSLLRHDRSVMLKCWENLLNLELIGPTDRGSGGRVQKEYRACSLNVLPSEIHEAVKNYDGLLMAVKDWSKHGLSDSR